MQDRPSAAELLEALAEYLYAELRPHVPPEQRFKTLVAANVCAVVAREIRAGAEPSIEDARLFRALMGVQAPAGMEADDLDETRAVAEALARTIRGGALDDEIEEVAEALRQHVRRKLDVARPGYADL